MVHLRNNKIWYTLQDVSMSHDAMLECCEKHLVYLGFGIFLRLIKGEPMIVLGTITTDDPQTQHELVTQAQMHVSITPSLTGTTAPTCMDSKKNKRKPSTAAGSAAQLAEKFHRVKDEPVEMQTQ